MQPPRGKAVGIVQKLPGSFKRYRNRSNSEVKTKIVVKVQVCRVHTEVAVQQLVGYLQHGYDFIAGVACPSVFVAEKLSGQHD